MAARRKPIELALWGLLPLAAVLGAVEAAMGREAFEQKVKLATRSWFSDKLAGKPVPILDDFDVHVFKGMALIRAFRSRPLDGRITAGHDEPGLRTRHFTEEFCLHLRCSDFTRWTEKTSAGSFACVRMSYVPENHEWLKRDMACVREDGRLTVTYGGPDSRWPFFEPQFRLLLERM
jgi:hypothetical protein